MPVYTLWLSTQITTPVTSVVPIDQSNLAKASWRVDFDSLFRKENYNYKYCRVRYNLIGESFTASSPAGGDWTNYNSYLAVSLPSSFNSLTTSGTVLGLVFPQDSPITGTGVHCIISNTMNEYGVDINVPTSTQVLTVTFMNWITNLPNDVMQNYQVLFAFELYN